ncbi:MAG: Cys-tRNA(Pro) deacylase [Propionibacteriaceae bacterium]|jgi:Cys-tRNA(Pro)/Cys-tRNA(Cys) deacylase|nr:Cys-tRNA(Pro) deacylase [Propionibacteriaceae bacterium]
MTKKAHGSPTPAVAALDDLGIDYRLHEYHHDPTSELGFGLEGAEKLGVAAQRVFKTLMVMVDSTLCTAVVPSSGMLNLKAMADAVHGKKADLAHPDQAQRATGYIVGGISPLGQKRRHRTVLDESALEHDTILVSGGRRGLSVELRPEDLIKATNATLARLGRA